MANIFDQFDTQSQPEAQTSVNPFDQFDQETSSAFKDLGNTPKAKPYLDDNMWDGMSYEDAMRQYEQMDPIYTDPDTGQNYSVPRPAKDPMGLVEGVVELGRRAIQPGTPDKEIEWEQATSDPLQKAGGMFGNVLRNVGEGVLAARDFISGTNDHEGFSKGFPIYPTRGALEGAVEDVAPMIAGGAGGARLVSKSLPKAIETTSQIMTWLRAGAVAGGAGGGAALPAPTDSSTLLVGDRAMFPLTEGLDLGNEGSAKVVEDRMNILVDSLILGGAFKSISEAGKFTTGFLNEAIWKKMTGAVSEGSREEAFVSEILDALTTVRGPMTNSERMAMVRDLAQKISDNKELSVNISNKGIDDINITRDTMSALEKAYEGDNSEEALKLITRARQLRKDTVSKGSPYLEDTIAAPNLAIDKLGRSIDDTYNTGGNVIEEGAERIQGAGIDDVQRYRDLVNNTEAALTKEAQDIESLLKNDPTFGERLNRLSNKAGFDINVEVDDTFDTIKGKLEQGYEQMTNYRNELHAAIPDGVVVDQEALGIVKENLKPYLNKKIWDIVEGADGDYKTLYNEVLPLLRRETNFALKNGDFDRYHASEKLREFIRKDSMDFIIEGSDEVAANAAKKVLDYEREVYYPMWGRGQLKRFAEGIRLKNLDEVEGSRKVRQSLETSLSTKEPEYGKQLVDTLSSETVEGNPSMVMDYIIGDAARTLNRQIASGKTLDDIDLNTITTNLAERGRVLRENFPEEYARIDNFIKSLQAKQGNVKSLTKQLDEATKAADEAEEYILGGELKEFFQKNAGGIKGYSPKSNGFESFETLLNDKNNLDKVTKLFEMGSQDPTINKALKVAYTRHLRNKVLMGQEGVSGASRLDVGGYRSITEGSDPLLQYGDIIFQDQPEIPYITRRLLGESHEQAMSARAPTASGAMNVNPKDFSKDARQISDFFITLIWGPLSRAGARIRTGSSRVISTMDKAQRSDLILDKIYADPDYFLEVTDRLLSKGQLSTSSRERAGYITDWLIRSGIYGSDERPKLEGEFTDFFDSGGLEQPAFDDTSAIDETERALQE